MPTPTYIPLQTVTLSSNSSSVTFSNIPSTYRDLILVTAVRTTGSGYDNVRIQFNNDTGSNYSWIGIYYNGSTPAAARETSTSGTMASAAVGYNAAGICQILEYSVSTKQKVLLSRDNSAAADNGNKFNSVRWANNSPITSIRLIGQSNSFYAGSTFSLYGIAG